MQCKNGNASFNAINQYFNGELFIIIVKQCKLFVGFVKMQKRQRAKKRVPIGRISPNSHATTMGENRSAASATRAAAATISAESAATTQTAARALLTAIVAESQRTGVEFLPPDMRTKYANYSNNQFAKVKPYKIL